MLSLVGVHFGAPGPLELLILAVILLLPLMGIGGVFLIVGWLLRKDRRQTTGQSPFAADRPTAEARPVDAEILED